MILKIIQASLFNRQVFSKYSTVVHVLHKIKVVKPKLLADFMQDLILAVYEVKLQ